MTDLVALHEAKKSRKPAFLRQDYSKKKRLSHVWRKPKGVDSKLRKRRKGGYGFWPEPGYGSPASIRGTDWRGRVPVVVCCVDDLTRLDAKRDGVIVGAGVGLVNAQRIIDASHKKGFMILNVKKPSEFGAVVKQELAARKERRRVILQRRAARAAAEKKVEKTPAKPVDKPAVESVEEKAAQAKAEKDKVLTKRDA